MTRPRTFDARTLDLAQARLAESARARIDPLDVLESVSSRLANLDTNSARYRVAEKSRALQRKIEPRAQELVDLLGQCKIPAPLALASLADRAKNGTNRRTMGAYYTDSRLARRLASRLPLDDESTVVDPACGSGMLLAAAALRIRHEHPEVLAEFLSKRLVGIDLDEIALRGATLSIGALAEDEATLINLRKNLIQGDALLLGPKGLRSAIPAHRIHFIANPPWEQARVTVQELAKRMNDTHHYGAPVDHEIHAAARDSAAATREYADQLRARYQLLASGTVDLWNAFLELMHESSDDRTVISALLPAGLLRNHGTRSLRSATLLGPHSAQVDLYDNKPAFFDIDSRFKFAHVTLAPRQPGVASLRLTHPVTPNGAIYDGGQTLTFGRRRSHLLGKDGLVPELRTRSELETLEAMFHNGALPGFLNAPGTIVREVDMTNDRDLFVHGDADYDLPLIEGRMVHQYDAGAKRYEGGRGRSAKWISNGVYANNVAQPQFGLRKDSLSERLVERIGAERIGFCDVTGQTNERTMLAAVIPEHAVCGNKVPTLLPDLLPINSTTLVHIWNSFAFDWMVRRYVTTSMNFFILRSMPLPRVLLDDRRDPVGDAQRRLDFLLAKMGQGCQSAATNIVQVGRARAHLEASILSSYGVAPSAVDEMLHDFPSLDRHQPPLEGEERSTVTRDLILAEVWAEHDIDRAQIHERRSESAIELGAVPFVPSDAARAIAP